MKKKVFSLMMTLLLVFFGVARADELTVNNGTVTDAHCPIYGLYADTQGTNSEFIIPAADLAAMNGGSISSMTFYLNYATSAALSATWQVYLAEVSGTTLSGVSGPSAGTVVYTGTINTTTTTVTITFDTPYTYNGGNLLVGSYVSVAGSNYATTTFLGVQATSTGYYQYEGWSGLSAYAVNFMPKTTFEYTLNTVAQSQIWDFEDSTTQGWTSIDADGDGYNWMLASEIMSTGQGHNASVDCMISQSYSNDYGALTPDNYLVSPQVQLGGTLTFYACGQDASWAGEHFGVAVSTTSNTDASAFTTIQEWDMTAKSGSGVTGPGRGGQNRAQGNWYEYTVDLSAYSGMGYVAIRHFDCTDMFYLDVDDIELVYYVPVADYEVVDAIEINGFVPPVWGGSFPEDNTYVPEDANYTLVESGWSSYYPQRGETKANGRAIDPEEINNDPNLAYYMYFVVEANEGYGFNNSTVAYLNGDENVWDEEFSEIEETTATLVTIDFFAYEEGLHTLSTYGLGENQYESIDRLIIERPNGAWMEPFHFQLYNDGSEDVNVVLIDFLHTNQYFSMVTDSIEYPFTVEATGREGAVDLYINTNYDWTATDLINSLLAVNTNERSTHLYPIIAGPYTPYCPDVFEKAYPLGNVLDTAWSMTTMEMWMEQNPEPEYELHNNYDMPDFEENIPDGKDAVIKFTVDRAMMLSAWVSGEQSPDADAENAKVALYTEDFFGRPGPMADNNYTERPFEGLGGGNGGGGDAAGPFDVVIGNEESTTTFGYCPYYNLFYNSIAEALYTANELLGYGVTTAPMTSLSWYANTISGSEATGIKIWMGNVDDTELGTTSHLTSNMTLVFEGSMNPVVGWNEFVFNQGTFAWDGHSNVLICVNKVDNDWDYGLTWRADNAGFYASAYDYDDDVLYNSTTSTYDVTHSQTRSIIKMKSNGGRAVFPAVDNTGLTLGTSTDGNGGRAANDNRDGWLYYDDGEYETSIGIDAGATIYWGSMFPASMLNDNTLTKVALYENDYNTDDITLYVCQGGTDAPGTMIYTETFAAEGNDDFHEVTLASPVTIDPSQNLWIIFSEYGTYVANACVDTGDANNRWISLDGSSWMDVAAAGVPGYGWMVRAYTEMATEPIDPEEPVFDEEFSAGPVIHNLNILPGTYYLVASSTEDNYRVNINVEDLPCPEQAIAVYPPDNADRIEPASVTLKWHLSPYCTEYRLVFSTMYWPDDNLDHPQTIVVGWTDQLAEEYTVTGLWNNTNYFWRVDQRTNGGEENGGCTTIGNVFGFTTTLNIPQQLVAVPEMIFEGDTTTLMWDPIVDRSYRYYFIYQDSVKIGQTTVNQIGEHTYDVTGLEYNMEGYVFNVAAVYDEGISDFSNDAIVKVSGYSNTTGINGYVYEQDSITPVDGATITITGTDEFGNSHTYHATSDSTGYYSIQVYVGNYTVAVADKEGYQQAVTSHELPFDVAHQEQVDNVDFYMDEIYYAPAHVCAEKVFVEGEQGDTLVHIWWDFNFYTPLVEDFEDFENTPFQWENSAQYPWTVTTTDPYEGTYCLKSGGAGVNNVVSDMVATVDIEEDGFITFYVKPSCENGWDYGYFYIDGVQKGSFTGEGTWSKKQYAITAGSHTFKWSYTKDSSFADGDDCIYIDFITFNEQPEPATPGMTYDFEDSSMQGWTSIDADGDGYGWYMGSDIMTGQTGNNGSNDFVVSQSYYMGTILYPDNYFVSPQVALGGIVKFYACAQDASYPGEHFGVAVSTTNNTDAAAFTTIQEWTMSAKSGADNGKRVASDSRSGRAQGNWYEFTVDLSAYAGQTGYVAIRHFDCSDMFYLDVDDITISDPNRDEANRALHHFRVYRTDCYNDGPYTSENTELLASAWMPDYTYFDVSWPYAEPGSYKYGVSAVYAGNRDDEDVVEYPVLPGESEIIWSNLCGPCVDKDMYLDSLVTLNVVMNSYDSPEGTVVTFVNTNEGEQYNHPMDPITLDQTGYYVFPHFRKGNYNITVEHDGFFTILDYQEIWSATDLRYVMVEKIFNVKDLYVSRTGWAMWEPRGTVSNPADSLQERHLEYYKVMCESIDHEPIFNVNTDHNFCQVATDQLVEGEHYVCKVAAIYSTGMSDYEEVEWVYEPCENYVGTVSGVVNDGGTITWEYPGGGDQPGPQPGDEATIILNIPSDVWGDGSGYQMLLDADATAYGDIIPTSGGLTSSGNAPAGMYDNFEYKIPENADGNLNTSNIIVTGSGSVNVPAGTYDWCITNPTPGDRVWIASSNGNIPGRFDDYIFEAGKTYTFTVTMGGTNDRVDLTITDSEGRAIGVPVRSHPAFSSTDRVNENYVAPALCKDGTLSTLSMTLPAYAPVQHMPFRGATGYANCIYSMTWPEAYLSFDVDAPASANSIGTAYVDRGGDYCDGFFYGFDSDGVFYKINYETGAIVDQHSTSHEVMTEMAYNYADNTMYAIDNSGDYSVLTTVDLATGAVTDVATLDDAVIAFAIDLEGNAYGISINTSDLIGIDLATGATTTIGNTGVDCNYVQCMNFDHNTETLYWFQIYSISSCGLYTVNTTTAEATLLMNTPGEVTSFFVPFDGTTPTPTPTANILGAMVFVDGEWEAFVEAPTNTYTYEGDGEVCIRLVYDGTKELPDGNFYYAMSCEECAVDAEMCPAGDPIYADVDFNDQVHIWWGNDRSDKVVKYNVYRSTDNASYSLIGEVAANRSGLNEYFDNPGEGMFYYQVTAVYSSGCESAPAVSGIDPAVNYVVIGVTGINELDGNVNLFPNPTNSNVTIQAQGMQRITIVSVLGQVVFDTELDASEYTVNMSQFNAGMYLVRVYTENGVAVKRVTVIQ